MEIKANGKLTNIKEIAEVWRRYSRNRIIFSSIGIAIAFGPPIVEIIGQIFFSLKAGWFIGFLTERQWFFIIIFLVLTIIFLNTKAGKIFVKRYFSDLYIPLNKVAIPYKKAEEDIIYGIQRERVRWVKRGVERLEGLNEYLSEMPEYNELLEKGKNWLKENEGK